MCKFNKQSESLEWRESFSCFNLTNLESLLKGYLNFKSFVNELEEINTPKKFIWLLNKELFFMLKPNYLHWKLNKVNHVLQELYEQNSSESDSLFKGN